jgi:hypothetical protein
MKLATAATAGSTPTCWQRKCCLALLPSAVAAGRLLIDASLVLHLLLHVYLQV